MIHKFDENVIAELRRFRHDAEIAQARLDGAATLAARLAGIAALNGRLADDCSGVETPDKEPTE